MKPRIVGIVCCVAILFAAALPCSAKDPAPAASGDEAPVTFTEHIAPIVFAKCATCHRPGEVAPFSLHTYQDAAKRNRYRDLAPRFQPDARPYSPQKLEDDLLRRETRESPQLAILTDVVRSRSGNGNTGCDFHFTLVKRAQSAERVLRAEVRPDGSACIAELR